jgi:hypothetical protein
MILPDAIGQHAGGQWIVVARNPPRAAPLFRRIGGKLVGFKPDRARSNWPDAFVSRLRGSPLRNTVVGTISCTTRPRRREAAKLAQQPSIAAGADQVQ